MNSMPKDFGLVPQTNEEYNLAMIDDLPCSFVTAEEIAEISLVDEKRTKQAITNLRKRTAVQADQRKLKEVTKSLDNLEGSSSILNNPDIWARVAASVKTTQDLKFLAEFREKEIKNIQNLMRTDSVDGQGTAGFSKVALAFEDNHGNRTKMVLSTEQGGD